MYIKDPALALALETLNIMANASSNAGGAFSSAFPQANNPFFAFHEVIHAQLSRLHDQVQRTMYDFGGPEHQVLMDRWRNESLFHLTYPDQFPKPPTIEWPPAYDGSYVSDATIRNWLYANADVLPESFTIELPTYREKFHRLQRGTGETILRLYGQEIVAHSPSHRAMITEEQFIEGLRAVASGELIDPKDVKGDMRTTDGIVAAQAAGRALLKALREYDSPQPYTDEDEATMRRLQSDLLDFINNFDRRYNRVDSVTELRVSWRKFYYRLAAFDSQLTTLWDPLVVEALPKEEEKKDEV